MPPDTIKEKLGQYYAVRITKLNADIESDIMDSVMHETLLSHSGIDNDIYSTVDACPNACEMWKAIERLKQGESINVQDLETNLYWEFGKFTSRDAPEQSNELRDERLAHSANPLAHVAQQQLIYHPKNHPNNYTQNSSTRSQQAATRNRGKAIVNSPPPTYDQEPTMVVEDDEMSKEKEIDKLMALISLSFKKIYKPTNNNLRTSSNTSRANQDNTLIINRGTRYDNQRVVNVAEAKENVARECQKPKRAKDAAYHKENMLLCKQEDAGFQLNAEQADWRDDTDDEPGDQELEAHYPYMAQIQEVTPYAVDNSEPIFDAEPLQKVQNNNDNYNVFAIESEHPEQPGFVNDTYPVEQNEHNIIIDSLDMSYDREQDDQDDDDLANEHDLLASLIEKLKCEIDDSKNRNKFFETSNKALVDKLKGEIEDFKTKNKSLESSNNHFKEENNELSKTNRLMFKDLKKFQAELDKYHDVNYASKVAIDCAKAKGDLMSYKMESEKSFNEYTRKINDLNQMILEMKKELFAHQETISIMSQEKEAQIKFYKTREDKEIEKVIALENKVKALDDIVYKTGCYNDNHALMLAPECDETIRLAQESRSKLIVKCERLEKELSKSKTMSKSFEALQKHAINLKLALQQCKEQIKNDKAFKENQSNVFLKEREQYFEIQDLKAQLQDKVIAISELKKLIEKMKGKSVKTKFEKSSVIRKPNAFKNQRQSILSKPATFSDSLAKTDFSKSKLVTTNNVSNDFSKPVIAQILPQNVMSMLKNTNVIASGMYKVHTKPNQTKTPQLPQDIRKTNKRVPFSTGVIPTTSVSRPQLKSNRLEDRVMPNKSQGKKHQVENHRRNFKISNNKTFVTACNDSLNAKTSNVNFVCVTCGKCVLNDNHDMCVLHYINGVNSRTKQPIAVLIIATESTVKKPRNTTRKLYEHVSKTCSWWYPKFTPSVYNGKPKSPRENVNTNVSMPLGNASRTANILEPMTPSQICDADLEVSFRKSTCCIRDLKGNDLLTDSRGTYLYFITLQDTSTPNPICLMAKATSSQAWLWHRRLSHLNFDTINLLSKYDIVTDLPKLKFVKDHLCSSCELGKAKQKYTWTHFLRSKDETPKVLIDFLILVQRGLHAQVGTVRTDKGTEFLNKTLHAYFAQEGIEHQTSTA
ncbi:retrovirus-related pol polyprotein from transposon TNT 1-94 [Tanacetum coccineum]